MINDTRGHTGLEQACFVAISVVLCFAHFVTSLSENNSTVAVNKEGGHRQEVIHENRSDSCVQIVQGMESQGDSQPIGYPGAND